MLSPHRIDILIAVTLGIACASVCYQRTAPIEPTREQRRRLRQMGRQVSRSRSGIALSVEDVLDDARELVDPHVDAETARLSVGVIDDGDRFRREFRREWLCQFPEAANDGDGFRREWLCQFPEAANRALAAHGHRVDVDAIERELGVDMASGEDATAIVVVGTDRGPGESPVAPPLEAAAAPLAEGAADGPPEQCGGS